MNAKIELPSPFLELVAPTKQWRHYLYHGGRSSGKSTSVASFLVAVATNRPVRVLCCREVQRSIKESVHRLLSDCIERYNLPGWVITDETLKNRNGSEFIFKGLHGNEQNVKSTEGVDICWVEEAQSVSMNSVDVLIPTIRKQGSFLIWTMNRLTEEDPVWVRIAKSPDDRSYIRRVNSDEIEQLLSEETIFEREKMRKENPELFEHTWLGEPLTSNTGSVFGKQMAIAREQGRIGNVPYDGAAGVYTAWDLGIGDSTAIWFFQVVNNEVHFIDYYESSGEDLGHYLGVVQNKPWAGNYARHFLPHDARQRELQTNKTRVDFFADHGIYNVEVLRPTNFTPGQEDIDLVARPKFSLCWFDEQKCQRGIDCIRAYHYDYDDRNQILRSRPVHDWSSHASSAFIYAMIAYSEVLQTINGSAKAQAVVPRAFRAEQSTGF